MRKYALLVVLQMLIVSPSLTQPVLGDRVEVYTLYDVSGSMRFRANPDYVRGVFEEVKNEFGRQASNRYHLVVFGAFAKEVSADDRPDPKVLNKVIGVTGDRPRNQKQKEDAISNFSDLRSALDTVTKAVYADYKAHAAFPIVLVVTDGVLPREDMGKNIIDTAPYIHDVQAKLTRLGVLGSTTIILLKTDSTATTDVETYFGGSSTIKSIQVEYDTDSLARRRFHAHLHQIASDATRPRPLMVTGHPGIVQDAMTIAGFERLAEDTSIVTKVFALERADPQNLSHLDSLDALELQVRKVQEALSSLHGSTKSQSWETIDNLGDASGRLAKFIERTMKHVKDGSLSVHGLLYSVKFDTKDGASLNMTTAPRISRSSAEAVADFLMRRLENDIVVTYLSQLESKLSKFPLQQLFPKTRSALRASSFQNSFRFTNYGQPLLGVLQDAAREDLKMFPDNIVNSVLCAPDGLCEKDQTNIRIYLERIRMIYAILCNIKHGENIFDALEHAPEEVTKSWKAYASIQIAARAIKETIVERQDLLDSTDYKINLSLLILNKFRAMHPDIDYSLDVEKAKAAMLAVIQSFYNLSKQAERVDKNEMNADEVAEYVSYLQSMIVAVQDLGTVCGEPPCAYQDYLAPMLVYTSAWRNDYSGLLIHLFEMVELIQENIAEKTRDDMKYMGLIAGIASARNGDDMNSAMETFANPPGSFRMKREHQIDLTISAYPSIFISKGVGPNLPFDIEAGFGFPVGLDYTVGGFSLFGRITIRTFSIGVSMFDFGAPVTAQISFHGLSDPHSKGAETTWESVIAPGVFLNYPLGDRSPFGMLLGFSFQKISDERYLRLKAGISYDLNLFNVAKF